MGVIDLLFFRNGRTPEERDYLKKSREHWIQHITFAAVINVADTHKHSVTA